MKPLTEIISELEKNPNRDNYYEILLALAVHLKNLENKLAGIRDVLEVD